MRPSLLVPIRNCRKATTTTRSLCKMSTGIPSQTAQTQKVAEMSTSSTPSELGIESTVQIAPGVELSSRQKVLVGSVLDVRALSNYGRRKRLIPLAVCRKADFKETIPLDRLRHLLRPPNRRRGTQTIPSSMVRSHRRFL